MMVFHYIYSLKIWRTSNENVVHTFCCKLNLCICFINVQSWLHSIPLLSFDFYFYLFRYLYFRSKIAYVRRKKNKSCQWEPRFSLMYCPINFNGMAETSYQTNPNLEWISVLLCFGLLWLDLCEKQLSFTRIDKIDLFHSYVILFLFLSLQFFLSSNQYSSIFSLLLSFSYLILNWFNHFAIFAFKMRSSCLWIYVSVCFVWWMDSGKKEREKK